MKSLHAALLAARQAAGVLPRDESTARRDGRVVTYPSQDAIQEERRKLEAHGLLLLAESAELTGEGSALFSWSLIHVETGERLSYVLKWPLFVDIEQAAHQLAAAWDHAEGHVVRHVLALRVAKAGAAGPAEPYGWRAAVAPPRVADELGPLPEWADAGRSGYTAEALHELIEWWRIREEQRDRAEGRPPTSRGVAHVWARCNGRRPPTSGEVLPGLGREQLERMWAWLTEEKRRAST